VDWFDPSDDVVIRPETDRARFWRHKYGADCIDVAERVLFANNGHGRLFDAVCEALDRRAALVHDHREQGYGHYRLPSASEVTVYRAPEPAPYAAADLEFLISAGAREILFLNGAGSLRADVPVGKLILPEALVREEGTSFHYAPPDVTLRTDEQLNGRIYGMARSLGIALVRGRHWTTDAILCETYAKVERLRHQGVVTVDMELSALAGVTHYRGCALSALLVVTDVLSREHTWNETTSQQFHREVQRAAQIAAQVFL
jgi:uridine phosphorylase